MTEFVTVSSNMALAIDVFGTTVSLQIADINLPRKDLVFMRVLPWCTEVEMLIGTPAADPVPPALPAWLLYAYPRWLQVASVTVPAGCCALSDHHIEDLT